MEKGIIKYSPKAIGVPGFLQESLEKNPIDPVNPVQKKSLIKIRIHSKKNPQNQGEKNGKNNPKSNKSGHVRRRQCGWRDHH
jgi:hypothetical protein